MFKIVMIFLFSSIVLLGSTEFSLLYKVEKGGKKLGVYEVNFLQDSIVSNSYGAANKLEMFSQKRVKYVKDGFKSVGFVKNNKKENFLVYTKLSALDEATKKRYARKFKKVKKDAMLFITKDTKKRIELFNKRAITLKTIDEVLHDIYAKQLHYTKFILFDKLGVMKMVAQIKKEKNSIIIVNGSKKKDYMQISLQKNIPVALKSLTSSWSATLLKSGQFKEYKVPLGQMVALSYKANLDDALQNADVVFSKIKKTKSYYQLSGTLTFTLPSEMKDAKSYKQKEYCKKLLKKSKVKHKKIVMKNGVCTTSIKTKIKIKKLKKTVLKELGKQYKQLKMTKKIKFNDDSITYEVL